MIKNTLIYSLLFSLLLMSCTSKEKGEYDTRAIESLDKLTETIGALASCSYTLNTISSKNEENKTVSEHDVYMGGPSKMYIHTVGTKGEKSYWYNGEDLAYYSYDKNEYATIEASGSILDIVEHINQNYGIDFPALDFFYPTLTDDIMNNYNTILFIGDETIDKVSCTLIEATNDNKVLQIWISNETNLPHRMVISSDTDQNDFYDIVFSNWRTNQDLPDLLFAFEAPTNSERIQLKSKN
ncbi:MAG: DUF2092 domain-containing protein [Flavobacteriaceae bacterium]